MQSKVKYLKGHIAVEGSWRFDTEGARMQGTNPQKVPLANPHVLLQGVLRIIVATTLATSIPGHQGFLPIHFHLFEPER